MTVMNGMRGSKRNEGNNNSLFNSIKGGKPYMSIEQMMNGGVDPNAPPDPNASTN